MTACKHENFEAHVEVNRFEDTGMFMTHTTVNCRDCGLPFEWLGLEPGVDLQGAKCSIDGLEARIAIIPQGHKPSPLQRMAFGVTKFDG